MKTPDAQAPGGSPKKQRTQLLFLGGLTLVLLVVLVKQFGQDEEATPTASAKSSVASAVTAVSSTAAAAQPATDGPDGLAPNAALSDRPADETVGNGAFDKFWEPLEVPDEAAPIEELPPPKIKLNATLVPDPGEGTTLSVAVIDGKLRYVGDNIQGWWLHSIGEREVALRSPGDRIETIAMPLLTSMPVQRASAAQTDAGVDPASTPSAPAEAGQDA